MAEVILENAFVSLDTVDFSAQGTGINIVLETEEINATKFNTNAAKTSAPGMKSHTISLNFDAEYGAAKIEEKLFTLWNNRTKFNYEVRKDAGAVAVGNPKYTSTGFISSLPILAASVGEKIAFDVTIAPTAAFSRATA